MSQDLAYKAILTLTPPSDDPVAVHVTLLPSDSVGEGANAKRLGDCTVAELKAYAEQLESEVAETYHDITIRTLLVEPEFGVAIDAMEENWLDHVVVEHEESATAADPTTSSGGVSGQVETPPSTDLEIEEFEPAEEVTDPIAAALEAAEQPVDDGETAEVAEAPIAGEPVVEDDVPVAHTESTTSTSLEEASESAEAELIPIEEIPPPEINIEEAEPIHEERVSETEKIPSSDPSPTIRTAGILTDGNYPSNNAVIIWLDEPPLRLMQGHARSSLRREVAGVMVGPRPEKQPDGRYVVHITDMIIAKHTKMSGASVTYTPESWRYMNDKLAEMYPDGDHVMLGWYHTHPGFGIFLSNMDLFIHTNFFTQKWHIAYVLDPVGFHSGFFSWDRAQSQVIKYGFPWPNWMNGSW